MVRCGSRASSRNTAVASKPMKDAMANMIAMPSEPETTWPGCSRAVETADRVEAPPRPITTASNTSTMATSAISSAPSTLLLSSMLRKPRTPTTASATTDHSHHGSAGPP